MQDYEYEYKTLILAENVDITIDVKSSGLNYTGENVDILYNDITKFIEIKKDLGGVFIPLDDIEQITYKDHFKKDCKFCEYDKCALTEYPCSECMHGRIDLFTRKETAANEEKETI